MTQGRLMHLSDIHFGCENTEALEEVRAMAVREDFDLIAITGDITQYGRCDEFAAAQRWVSALPGPVLATPGNHDVPYATPGRLFSPFNRYQSVFGPPWNAHWECESLAARSFNTARGVQMRMNWSKGVARPALVEQTARTFDSAPPEQLRAVLCHHPLMEVTGGPMTGEVQGGEAAVKVFGAAHVEMILTGHVHIAFAHELPSGGGGLYAIGAATLSRRERGQPAGFNIIEWDKGCITVKAQAWTGSHFETYRTWGLPRIRK